ncbi:uncharacterized protein CLUP02_04336 [Colletotrichum lupini]|uniref:Uncharacterized protein n=1 Tax=Colletotrichum lupini TaxID=145971 RepID=A0A9Q8SLX3_9PEZI|nr:uncharacterized protein CLUP02_04336 [Colletotrichum lupini]UQC78857.1 hypothetical protein CLUP02_04336 [Colletotrichum lupini]
MQHSHGLPGPSLHTLIECPVASRCQTTISVTCQIESSCGYEQERDGLNQQPRGTETTFASFSRAPQLHTLIQDVVSIFPQRFCFPVPALIQHSVLASGRFLAAVSSRHGFVGRFFAVRTSQETRQPDGSWVRPADLLLPGSRFTCTVEWTIQALSPASHGSHPVALFNREEQGRCWVSRGSSDNASTL